MASGITRRAVVTWLVAGALFLLCGVLGYLQYQWIGEVSAAARDRMRSSLAASLARLSLEFNAEISTAGRALLPEEGPLDPRAIEAEMAARYARWKRTSPHGQMFQMVAIAALGENGATLRRLDPEKGVFRSAEWPAALTPIRMRLEMRFRPWENRQPGAPPEPPRMEETEAPIIEAPLVSRPGPGGPGGDGPSPGDRPPWQGFPPRPGGMEMAIFELDAQYLRETLLPELLRRHLGAEGALEYDVEVASRTDPRVVIYRSSPEAHTRIARGADASVNLFTGRLFQFFRNGGPPGAREFRPEFGRWRMSVRHRAGSLEAVVVRTRWRNLAVTLGVLFLMVASVIALIRSTRRAQRLAEMQMAFVAGVSHELRTPLTVLHTAGYNLKGAVAQNPSQVEKYGALIQQESGRLRDLVEQVLRFASLQRGRVLQKQEPVSLEAVVDGAIQASEAAIQASQCKVEKAIEPDLPLVAGDATALQHMLQNLIGNAAKYGASGGWIGIFGSRREQNGKGTVEIRVADRGPGVPADEQPHVFDAFFRGRRALEDQVHGTGLGLNLAKRIAKVHGGSIELKSEAGQGAEFIVRLPAAPERGEA